MGLMESIRNKARQAGKTIVLPEGTEERTLKAADFILKEQIAKIILLGDPEKIMMLAGEWGLDNISKAAIINPKNNPRRKEFAGLLYEIRKHKGLSMEEAEVLVEDPLYLATLLIKKGEADGEVAGADNATGDVLRPAFQIVRTLPGIHVVSGAFIMIFKEQKHVPGGILVFADCAVHPDPTDV